jgi:uncharacterized protein (UPF0332 family)
MTAEQRDALVAHRLLRAKETLDEVQQILLQNNLYNTAVNRLYYASYYAVSALLINQGYQSKTHSGTKQLFGLHFVKPGIVSAAAGDFYSEIFDLRQNSDYGDFVIFEKDEVLSLLQPAQKLIAGITEILSK